MITTKLSVRSVNYVSATDLSKISDNARYAMEAFWASDLDVSFGDAQFTMIDANRFLQLLDEAIDQRDFDPAGYDDIADALDALPDDVYIDLEG
jgi:hypothetical protein